MPSSPGTTLGKSGTLGSTGGSANGTQKKNTLSAVAEVGGSLKQVEQAFSAYQVARNQFVNQLTVRGARGAAGRAGLRERSSGLGGMRMPLRASPFLLRCRASWRRRTARM